MFNRLNQFKETLSQELNGQKDKPDSIKQIEAGASILKTETPPVQQMDFFGEQDKDNQEKGETEQESSPEGDDIQIKLRKFAKYEEKYPQLLKAYRLEKKKAELVKVFEGVLAEHTPVSSIAEPQELLSYIDNLNQRSTLLKQELERVSDSYSRLRKKNLGTTEELEAANQQIKDLNAKISELESTVKEVEELRAQLAAVEAESKQPATELLQKNEELAQKIKELELELERLKSEAAAPAAAAAAADVVPTAPAPAPAPAPVPAPTPASSSKSKKKKKKGKGPAQPEPAPEPASEPAPEPVVEPTPAPAEPDSSSQKIKELEEQLENLKTQLNDRTEALDAAETKLSQSSKSLESSNQRVTAFEVELQEARQKLTTLSLKTGELERATAELQKSEKTVEDLKSKLAQSETNLKRKAQLETQIKEKDGEMVKLRARVGRISELEAQLAKRELSTSTTERSLSLVESERNSLLTQNQQFKSRVETAESEAASAKLSQESLVRQLEEARLRLGEATQKIDQMQDEITEVHRQSQERLQETITMRSLVNSRQSDRESTQHETERIIEGLKAEKESLELDLESMSKRLIRDTEPLRRQVAELKDQLEISEAKLRDTKETAAAVTPAAVSHVSAAASAPSSSSMQLKLEQTENALHEVERANRLLKQASKDSQERLVRLQKTNTTLSDDLEHARRELENRASRRGSTVDPNEEQKKSTYIKNVLLGFLEHKDERRQLMPVLSTLLQFEDGDEQRFWANL